jgi:DNA-binding MarR family transcriptional regulator
MVDTPAKVVASNTAPASDADNEGMRLGVLASFIGFHLRLAQEASFQAFARGVRQTNLRPGHLSILVLIGENPGISQTALGRAVGRDKSSLTPALNELKRRGLIGRGKAPQDRRSYALSLTKEGEQALANLLGHARAHDDVLDRIVGLDRKDEFIRTLQRIAAQLGDSNAKPGGPA